MAFTYGGDPTASSLAKVRFLIGDTDSTDYELEDAEINFMVSEFDDAYTAASFCADIIAGKFARQADTSKSVGDLSLSKTYSSRSREYAALAARLRQMDTYKNPPSPWISPDAIVSTSSRSVDDPTTDFWVGFQDNQTSVVSAHNEY